MLIDIITYIIYHFRLIKLITLSANQLRIISGKFKGKKLTSFKGQRIRPTSDRVREAIFDILTIGWEGKDVLDFFAGTGGLGIETLSRGARGVFL